MMAAVTGETHGLRPQWVAGGIDPLVLYQAAVDTMPDAMIIIAADGRVLHANPAHEALFGGVATWHDDYRPLWQPAAQAVIEQRMAEGGDWEGVLEARDGGLALWCRLVTTSDAKGRPLFLTAFLRNYAAARQAEQAALRAREEAEKANQAKTRFLAAASHDLRQPLQALAMFVSVLSNRDHAPADRKIISRIEESLAATDALLTSLLDISKLDAGMVTPSPAPVPVQRILDAVCEEFSPVAAQAGLRLRLVDCAAVVQADATLVERILRNLVANALRYTDSGGVLIGCRRRGDRLRIEVHDSGPGIPQDQFGAIFREFHQLGNSARDRRQGLGLGLAIVDRLAKLLDVPVGLRSTPHAGSVFSLELPLSGGTAPRVAAPCQLDLDIRPGGGLIAIIDDEPDIRDSMRLVLEGWGYAVVAAGDAEDAIDQCVGRKLVPDLLIADYRLSNGSTGGQAIARLRQRLKARIPAIILTGDTAPERLRMARANGHGLLHKPVQPAALRQAIDEARSRPHPKRRK